MTEPAGSEARRELADIWREWLTQSERQMNAFLSESMNTDAAGRGMGSFVEMYAVFQRNLAQAMERYLTMMNIPTRADITALAETLRSIEERLSRIEETLLIAAEAVDGYERAEQVREPARTRRPWEETSAGLSSDEGRVPVSSEVTAAEQRAVPDELRR